MEPDGCSHQRHYGNCFHREEFFCELNSQDRVWVTEGHTLTSEAVLVSSQLILLDLFQGQCKNNKCSGSSSVYCTLSTSSALHLKLNCLILQTVIRFIYCEGTDDSRSKRPAEESHCTQVISSRDATLRRFSHDHRDGK